MSKKGFTLVELLGVIALLAIIMLISVKSIVGIRTSSLEKIVETKVKNIEQAAIEYGQENPEIFEDTDSDKECEYTFCKVITVRELINADYFQTNEKDSEGNQDLINNVTGESMLDYEVIIYRKNNRIYSHMVDDENDE